MKKQYTTFDFRRAAYVSVRIVGEVAILLACCWEAGLWHSHQVTRQVIEADPISLVVSDIAPSTIGHSLPAKLLLVALGYVFAKSVAALVLQKLRRDDE